MHDRDGALALSLGVLLLVACASAPAPQVPSLRDSTLTGTRSGDHGRDFFVSALATVAAIGGSNPNRAYRASKITSCVSLDPVVPASPIAHSTELQQTAVPAPCRQGLATQ